MSANKECEMPGADSCAVMEGEENDGDMDDDVVYTKPSLLGKLKAIASKVNLPSRPPSQTAAFSACGDDHTLLAFMFLP